MPQKDYYKVLGINPGAGKEEVKQAFRKLARELHPDVAEDKSSAEIHFREINEAYAVLSDDEKRAFYDRYGYVEGDLRTPDFDTLFDFGFGDLLQGLFGFSQGGRSRIRRGADLSYEMVLTLEEAYSGVEKQIPLHHYVVCPTCKGDRKAPGTDYKRCPTCGGQGQVHQVHNTFVGQIMQTFPCPECRGQGATIPHPCQDCRGQGKKIKEEKITVKIPAGVETGNQIRVGGGGEAGENGAPSGDLYIFVNVLEHKIFKRQGKDLWLEQPIPFSRAVLGGEISIPTLADEAVLTIPSGCQDGTVFELKGKGMPRLDSRRPGSLNVKISIAVPKKITGKQREVLEEFARIEESKAKDKGLLDKVKDIFQ